MTIGAVPRQLTGVGVADTVAAAAVQSATGSTRWSVTATHTIEDVELAWRALEGKGIDSPGQSFDFIKLWIEQLGIAACDQLYLLAHEQGMPVALMPLQRRNKFGVRVLAWFPGSHVGCNGPIVDAERLAAIGPAGRAKLWEAMAEAVSGADLMSLASCPQEVQGIEGLYAELGTSFTCDTLYRAQFSSWEECNATQRTKSRRKHDRQQGERLEALGEIQFEEHSAGPAAAEILDIMFRQRSARFAEMGVKDPFTSCAVKGFYKSTVAQHSSVPIKLHVLRLNGEVVAVRYNIVHGDKLFCLISSMSSDPAIQTGSPGKQCLLRVMQTIFDQGYRTFDMGSGLTDEKRHWCNRQIDVRQHYVPLTAKGRAAVAGHQMLKSIRARIKADASLFSMVKNLRSRAGRVRAVKAPVDGSE